MYCILDVRFLVLSSSSGHHPIIADLAHIHAAVTVRSVSVGPVTAHSRSPHAHAVVILSIWPPGEHTGTLRSFTNRLTESIPRPNPCHLEFSTAASKACHYAQCSRSPGPPRTRESSPLAGVLPRCPSAFKHKVQSQPRSVQHIGISKSNGTTRALASRTYDARSTHRTSTFGPLFFRRRYLTCTLPPQAAGCFAPSVPCPERPC